MKIRQQIYSDIADGHHQSVFDMNLIVPPDVTLPEEGYILAIVFKYWSGWWIFFNFELAL